MNRKNRSAGKKKGQASIEFLSLLIIVMLVSILAYVAISGRLSSSENLSGMQSACRKIAEGIKSAQSFGSGFSMNITLQQAGYSASVLDNSVICSDGRNVFMENAFGNITNSTGGSAFQLGSEVRIENSLGRVVIY